jgi:hypothetical protein
MAILGPLGQAFVDSVALDPPEDGIVLVSEERWRRIQAENCNSWKTVRGYPIRIVPKNHLISS